MYSVSSSFKSAIMSTSRTLKAKVVINSNTYDETYISDMSFEDASNPSDSFEIGAVASPVLTLSLIGVNEVFETATIKPYIGLDLGGTVEYVPLGVFYADDVDRKKDVVTLTCYDGMIKLEKAYFSDLTYPATITAVMNEICSKAGIQFTGTLPNYLISKKPEGYTYREVVAFIAQMCAGFAKFSRDGKLTIRSYASVSETITADSYVDFSKAKDQAFRVDKVTCQVDDKTISKGTLSAGGSEVTFENPFMTDAILTDVYNKLKGFQYIPIDLQYVGNPAYDVGDIVSLVTIDNETYSIPIMSHKLSYSGGLTGEIQSIGETENSNQFDSSGSVSKTVERVVYEQALIKEALIEKATIEDLEATNARIDDLVTNVLTAINAAIQNLQADKADITDLNAANARIDNLDATKADIDDLDATNARIDNLEATKANITDLDAVNAAIQNLQADKANITDLNATNARIDNLVTNDLTAINAEITNLKAGKANITDLNAVNATIATLQADVGSINTLLAGNLGAENFQAGAIYAGSGVIAQGAIGDAEISNLNASKINAGILNTALVTIQGANGRMKIANNRLQVFANKSDGSLYERISLGDVNGDGSVYGLRVRGSDGKTVLLDENGVKSEGITDGSITNDKIADDANISGTKLDIASVVTEINEGTTTIQSSKIFYNGKTLDIQLGTMQTTINNQGQTITNHETRITATEQGLATKVSVSQYQQDQAALSSQLSQMSTQIQQQASQIALKADASNVYTKSQIDGQFTTVNTQISNLSAQLTVQADQIASKVSKTEFDALQIGGRNLLRNTSFTQGLNYWSSGLNPQIQIIDGYNGMKAVEVSRQNYSGSNRAFFEQQRNDGIIKENQTYTISGWFYIDSSVPLDSTASDIHVRFYQSGSSGTYVDFISIPITLDLYEYDKWYYFKKTGTAPSGYSGNATISFALGKNGKLRLCGWKLELGNKATDWTPAPEDVDSQITGLGSRLSTAETSITQLSNQIALKANQSTVDNLTGQVSSLQAQLTVQADQIATKVEKDGVISAINQTAESIKIQASKVDLSGYVTFTNLSTPGQTTIDGGNIKANSITVEKLIIGDFTNLCVNPDFLGGKLDKWSGGVTAAIDSKAAEVPAGAPTAYVGKQTDRDGFCGDPFPVKPGDKFYVEFTAATGNSTYPFSIGLQFHDASGEAILWEISEFLYPTSSWTTRSRIITAPSGAVTARVWSLVNGPAGSTGTWYFSRVIVHRMLAGELIVDGSITADKLNVTSLSAITANLGEVTAGKLRGVIIEGTTINGSTFYSSGFDEYGNLNELILDSGHIHYHLGGEDSGEHTEIDVGDLGITMDYYTDGGNHIYHNEFTTNRFLMSDEFLSKWFSVDLLYGVNITNLNVEISFGSLNLSNSAKQLVLTESYPRDKQWHIEVKDGVLRFVETDIATRMTISSDQISVTGNLNVNGTIYAKRGWFDGQVIELSNSSLANIYIRPQSGGSVRFTAAGTSDSFVPIYASNVYANSIDVNGLTSGVHLYARPSSSGNLKVTAAGTTDVWRPVEAASFQNRSLEKYKQDIELWDGSALDIIRNSEIYQYRLKTDVQNGIDKLKYGFIIGEGYQTPNEVITPSGESVDIYVQSSVAWKAIQELDAEQQTMKDDVAWLKTENDYLKQKVTYLENKIQELEAQIA